MLLSVLLSPHPRGRITAMPDATTTAASPKRRWYQYSLRTLLIFMTIAGCGLAWVGMVVCAGFVLAQDTAAPKPAAKAGGEPEVLDSTSTKTVRSERLISNALDWLARHQNPNGSWSFHDFSKQCKDKSCTGPGTAVSETTATALGVLPFLAAHQGPTSKGPYQQQVQKAIEFLIAAQDRTVNVGNLGGEAKQSSPLDAHGLATMALCNAYGLTEDKRIGEAAQKAVDFIVASQDRTTGGWRCDTSKEEDTSVLGWRVSALNDAKLAGLAVPESTWAGATKWLRSCAHGDHGELFSSTPAGSPTPSMTAVGLLSRQRIGDAKRDDPFLNASVEYLVKHLPDAKEHDIYYWYFATYAMHNVPGPEWDTWNRQMRKQFVTTQVKEGCAAGSWDPEQPEKDKFGEIGGRLMVTSLSCLTLSVYNERRHMFYVPSDPPLSEQPADKKQ